MSYKLRRDISRVRHYCKEICTQCGGEAALSRDVCVCNIEEADGKEVQHCLEKAQNKFDFYGIKLETDNRPGNKRSIHRAHHSSDLGHHGVPSYVKGHQEDMPLSKSFFLADNIHSTVNNEQKTLHDGGKPGAEDTLRTKRSFNEYGNRFDLTRFAEIFRPKENNEMRPTTNFKILLGASEQPLLDRSSYFDTASQPERGHDEDCSEDESDSDETSDYSDGQIALGEELDLRRLENHHSNMYELIPAPDHSHVDDSIVQQFNSIWDSVLSEFSNPRYYVPTNFGNCRC